MKTLQRLTIFLLVLVYSLSSNSQQRIVISDKDDQQAHPSAVLELVSEDKGFLLSRMTEWRRDAIADPAESLMIFNTTNKCIEIWLDDDWQEFWCLEGYEPEPFSCGDTFTDPRDDNQYKTKLIGDQCWFIENLRFDNGCTNITWEESNDVGWCGWNEGSEYTDVYGLLYQWSAAIGGDEPCNGTGAPPNDICNTPVQGICPDGWHIPSPYEWITLKKQICINAGNDNCETVFPYNEDTGWRGTDEGFRIKTEGNSTWCSYDVCGTSGFNALASGYRNPLGDFLNYDNLNLYSQWWTSYDGVSNENIAGKIGLTSYYWFYNQIEYSGILKNSSLSVRCIKNL